MFNSRILSATAAIFLDIRTVFGFFMLWFIDEDANFFHFFLQDNEHTELTMLLFLQNPYAIFAHILQYYRDLQSNVAILLIRPRRLYFKCSDTFYMNRHKFKFLVIRRRTLDSNIKIIEFYQKPCMQIFPSCLFLLAWVFDVYKLVCICVIYLSHTHADVIVGYL